MLNKSILAAVLTLSSVLAASAAASTTSHANRAAFASSIGASFTDDYSNPGYVFYQNNAAMSAVSGQTQYQSTGFSNLNLVVDGAYCAGCNGSFLLDFTHTSYGSAQGVFGVGLDIVVSDNSYYAFVTYGDNSTSNLHLTGNFFGLTSSQSVKTIHFGLTGGVATTGGYIQIDNLTIAAAPVPEPETYALMLAGLAGVVGIARRRKVA